MMQKASVVALTGIIGFLAPMSESRIVDSACIKTKPLFGHSATKVEFEGYPNGRVDGDLSDIG